MAWCHSRVIVTCIMVSVMLESQMVRGTTPSVQKTCLFSETCVLPCTFSIASKVLIHWKLDKLEVHSYYQGMDQNSATMAIQFQGRTSLFHNQISKGNASLQLAKVKLQDEGKYMCYASTTKGNMESFIEMRVEAPVKSVAIDLSDGNITCCSRGIYPLPTLSWLSNPDHTVINQTHQERDSEGLYNITGSLLMMHDTTDVDYICSVSTGRQTRKATWRRQAPVQFSHCSVSLSCSFEDTGSQNFSLTWRFANECILTSANRTEEVQVQQLWRDKVQNVSDSGSLRLHRLTQAHQGTYTCERSMFGDTYVSVTDLKNSSDLIGVGVVCADPKMALRVHYGLLGVGVVCAIVFVTLFTISKT